MNKYRIENPNNNKVREYKSRTTEYNLYNSKTEKTYNGGTLQEVIININK